MSIRTPLCNYLNIDLPIIQAPMGNFAGPELVAAVSNAGGLGIINLTFRGGPDGVRETIREVKALTDRPFGVNFLIPWQPGPLIPVCLEEGVRIFSFHWGDFTPFVAEIHAEDGIVMAPVADGAEAKKIIQEGCDIVVAQGWESGGHVWGGVEGVASLPLIPAVVDASAPNLVIAAGGIGDGRGLAAALVLGASGGWLGTRFLASTEAYAHEEYKQRILDSTEADTYIGTLFDRGGVDGRWESAARAIRNSTIDMYEAAGGSSARKGKRRKKRPGEGDVVAIMPWGAKEYRYGIQPPLRGAVGDIEAMPHYCGQTAGVVKSILPAAEIVATIAEDAEAALQMGGSLVV